MGARQAEGVCIGIVSHQSNGSICWVPFQDEGAWLVTPQVICEAALKSSEKESPLKQAARVYKEG